MRHMRFAAAAALAAAVIISPVAGWSQTGSKTAPVPAKESTATTKETTGAKSAPAVVKEAPAAAKTPVAEPTAAKPSAAIDVKRVQAKIRDAIAKLDASGPDYLSETAVLIDESIYFLRGPNADGSAYYFAAIKRNETQEPRELSTLKIKGVQDRALETTSVETNNVYEVQVYSPMQRAFFKNNGEVFVGKIKVNFIIAGKSGSIEREINKWLQRGDMYTVPLPGIAERVRFEATVGVHPGDAEKTLVKLRALRPEITDDPKNPFTYSIDTLKDAQKYTAFSDKKEMIRKRLVSALDALELSPPVTGNIPTTNAQIAQKLEYILYLFEGNEVERVQARNQLKELIKTLKQ